MTHEFKRNARAFTEVFSGARAYEVLVTKSEFVAGDAVRMREWDEEKSDFTGREAFVTVNHVTKIDDSDWLVFGFTLQATTLRPPSGGWPKIII